MVRIRLPKHRSNCDFQCVIDEVGLTYVWNEVAGLDGVAQPGFEKATAPGLNEGLAECHRSGKTLTVGFVFRVPSRELANGADLAMELRWRDKGGSSFSRRLSLAKVDRVNDEGQKGGR